MSTVYVIGGGVAGLSAAHELAKRQFNVVVFEKHDICGGKARSMKNSAAGRPDLPGEHGFRFFPGFYWHLTQTMTDIVVDPSTGRTAFDNLQQAEKIAIAQDGKPLFFINATRPKTLPEWVNAFRELIEDPSLGISLDEGRFFVRKIFCFFGSGRLRRLQEYEGKSWWEYIDAQNKSSQYQAVLARGLSQSLVAMRPDKASALTVGTMLVQILLNIIEAKAPDRVLNAPTNDAWIDPWVAALKASGHVTILNNHEITQITYDSIDNKVVNVIGIDDTGAQQTWGSNQDHYISAVPVDVLKDNATLFPTSFKRAAGLSRPSSTGSSKDDGVDSLDTEWMSGVLFYLNRPWTAAKGHVIYANSSWALTSIAQRQFWRADYPWPTIPTATGGSTQVQDVFSTIISDWDSPGQKTVTRPAKQCTEQEIVNEAWAQLKAHLPPPGPAAISDSDLATRPFLDPAIKFDSAGNVSNEEPLLVNTKNSRVHRPNAATLIPNFFVASDYVLTGTDLACMEAANEAARLAVNALLTASGSMQAPCQTRPLQEPGIFETFQALDDAHYQVNPTDPPLLCQLVDALLPTAAPSGPSLQTIALIATLVVSALNLGALLGILYMMLSK